jgi:hypothetical protein
MKDCVKLWSLARTSTNYCYIKLLYYGQKDRDGQLMMTLDEIYVCKIQKKKSFQNWHNFIFLPLNLLFIFYSIKSKEYLTI